MPVADAADDLAAELALIADAAEQAGRIAFGFFRKDPQAWLKAGSSPVSEADIAVDRYLRETLGAARPHYGWLSEETADGPDRLGRARTFVVDPIDGTRGFLEGRSEWCVSVAVVQSGRPLAGVLACPARGETFQATAGGGAFMDTRPIRVRSPGESLDIGGPRTLLAGLAPDIRGRMARVHYIPSLAYRIAAVACGRLDATFVKPGSHDWDLAAADLILAEAGGAVVDPASGVPRYGTVHVRHGALVAGSGPLLASLCDAVRQAEG